MTTYRTVVPDADRDEMRMALEKRYGNRADIEFREGSDFLGNSWIEAVIHL